MRNFKQKRIFYLLRKLAANIITLTAYILGALACITALLGTILTAVFITDRSLISPMLLLPLMIAVPALVIFKVMALCNAQAERARSIPYVPPVSTQIDQLPNDAVLVRAAEQPDDHQQLLRGASGQSTAEPDELLHSV